MVIGLKEDIQWWDEGVNKKIHERRGTEWYNPEFHFLDNILNQHKKFTILDVVDSSRLIDTILLSRMILRLQRNNGIVD